jgi:hypothetical protein
MRERPVAASVGRRPQDRAAPAGDGEVTCAASVGNRLCRYEEGAEMFFPSRVTTNEADPKPRCASSKPKELREQQAQTNERGPLQV